MVSSYVGIPVESLVHQINAFSQVGWDMLQLYRLNMPLIGIITVIGSDSFLV